MPFCGYLKQSTAVDVLLGPFVDDTDGKSAEVGLTLDVEVSKNGQALANKSDATAPVHDAAGTVDGYYNCELDGTDTGTLGILSIVAHAAGFLPVHQTYQIVTAHWWDTMCSTDYLHVDVKQIEAADPTDTIRDSVVDDATRLDASSLNAIEAKVDTADTVVDGIKTVTDALPDAGALSDLATILTDTGELQTDNIPGTLSTIEGKIDTADTVVDAIKTVTDALPNAGALSDLAAILTDTNELQTDWKNAGRLDLLIDAIKTVTDSIVASHASILGDTNMLQLDWQNGGRLDLLLDAVKVVTDSLTDLATVADAVWDEALSAHDSEDTIGNVLNDLTEESAGTYRFTSAALAEGPSQAGAGAITFTYTLTSSVDASPIASATVWVTTDEAGTNVVASGVTDTSGQVVFYLDAATYYVWREKAGYNFTNPDTEAVA